MAGQRRTLEAVKSSREYEVGCLTLPRGINAVVADQLLGVSVGCEPRNKDNPAPYLSCL